MLYQTKNPHGGEIYAQPVEIDFSANINPYGTPPGVLRAVKESLSSVCHYPDPYCRELIKAISAFESVPAEYILCGNGAADLIFAFCYAKKPKKAMLLSPCFSEYETALNAAGCSVSHYTLLPDEQFALTERFLQALLCWDGDLVMLCNPNNPTGQLIERQLSESIAAVCRKKGIFLFVDECFLDLTENGEQHSLKPFLQRNDQLLLLKAFTKSYGMAGLRLGYCLSGNAPLLKAMGQTTQAWNVSTPAQAAGIAALKEQVFLQKANRLICSERKKLTEGLRELGFSVIPSKTNYLLFYSDRELHTPLLERRILIRNCANYRGLSKGWYRIAVKLPKENHQLLNAIKEICNG